MVVRAAVSVVLAIVGVLALAFSLEDGHRDMSTVHGVFETLRVGAAGGGVPLLLGWAYGALQVILFGLLLTWGIRGAGERDRGASRVLGLATLIFLATWTALVVSYSDWSASNDVGVVWGLPAPTSWMIYGIWLVPTVFVVAYVWNFDRWVFGEDERRRLEALLARRSDEA